LQPRSRGFSRSIPARRLIEQFHGFLRKDCTPLDVLDRRRGSSGETIFIAGVSERGTIPNVSVESLFAGSLSNGHRTSRRWRLDDWIRFSDARAADFNQWCVERGRKYRWINAYYYSVRGR